MSGSNLTLASLSLLKDLESGTPYRVKVGQWRIGHSSVIEALLTRGLVELVGNYMDGHLQLTEKGRAALSKAKGEA